MLSAGILEELRCFSAMVFYGVVTAMGYHLLLFFRAILKHRTAVTDAEDILFLSAAGIFFFLTVYRNNGGILRWYAFAGAALGCFAYIRTLGASLEAARKRLLQKQGKTVKMKAKSSSKGKVPLDEGSVSKHGKKEEKKKRS